MAKLRLVHVSPNPVRAAQVTVERRYETDYAGAWRGHCKTRESAIIAAMKHVVNDGYNNATITDKHTGQTVARIKLSTDRRSAHVYVEKPLKKVR